MKITNFMALFSILLSGVYSNAGIVAMTDTTSEANKWALEIFEASPAIYTDEYCSGAFISNSGHYMTALHCLKNLLPKEKIEIFKGNPKFGGIEGLRVLNPKSKILLQSPNEHGWFQREDLKVHTASVEISGMGAYLQFANPTDLHNLSSSDRDKLSQLNQDFVILKFDLPKEVKCLKMAATEISSSVEASIYGYSDRILNSSTRFVGVIHLYHSEGTLFDSNNPSVLGTFEQSQGMYNSSIVALSAIPVFPGMSGSPMLNHQNEILGVAVVGFYGEQEDWQESKASMLVKSSFIKKYVEKNLGFKKSSEIFNCK